MARGWCKLHYDRWRNTGTTDYETFNSDSERFWSKVDKSEDCWLWTGGVSRATGYGHFWLNGTTTVAHRFAYVDLVDAVPEGYELDHLCRNRRCVRPDHLEPVTHTENVRRGKSPSARNALKTHCLNGHPFDEVNTYHYNGKRHCKACQARRDAEHLAKRRSS